MQISLYRQICLVVQICLYIQITLYVQISHCILNVSLYRQKCRYIQIYLYVQIPLHVQISPDILADRYSIAAMYPIQRRPQIDPLHMTENIEPCLQISLLFRLLRWTSTIGNLASIQASNNGNPILVKPAGLIMIPCAFDPLCCTKSTKFTSLLDWINSKCTPNSLALAIILCSI